MRISRILLLLLLILPHLSVLGAGAGHGESSALLPQPLSTYEAEEQAQGITGLGDILLHRIEANPFNLVATAFFVLAIIHTFVAGYFRKLAHKIEHRHHERIHAHGRTAAAKGYHNAKDDTSFWGTVFHFLGEVEAIFGLWLVPLFLSIFAVYGWSEVKNYVTHSVVYTEPMFVVIIMAISSTRPVLKFAERILGVLAGFGGRTPTAWWLALLIVAPVLGSFITEPAAMTIAALLLSQQFYRFQPSEGLKYGTLGLLFVNISVGGTLTHFAAPPVVMVAGTWGWDTPFMLMHFGWKACVAIVIATVGYYFFFRKELADVTRRWRTEAAENLGTRAEEPIPLWITGTVLLFLAWTVLTLHAPALFVGGFLFFLAFVQATATHQDNVSIRGPLLVGFFLAGLVTHGTLQSWWISPVLSSLGEVELFIGATILTSFNDNAAITFLASQVPSFNTGTELAHMQQYAVMAGAVAGGGLTVIANAPNPAGQSILQGFFNNGVSPLRLARAAIFPTCVVCLCFMSFGRQ